jgi:alpha-beta hydrolase superfamily lysophospholipase
MPITEELRFRAGSVALAGTLLLPDGVDGRVPWSVLVPSWLPRDRDGRPDRARHAQWFVEESRAGLLVALADALAARGVASLRYDARGCGDSEGIWSESDLFTRIDDARDAIGAMRGRPELEMRRTAIVGHGEGALIALSVAIGDPAIGAVGLIGPPARSFRDVLRRGAAQRSARGSRAPHPGVATLDRFAEEIIERADRHEASIELPVLGHLSLRGWQQAFGTPAVALATMLHRNVVIAHGADDAWSHPDESRLLDAALREQGNDPVVQLVPGADHDLAGGDPGAVDRFADALVARMESRTLPPVLVAIEQLGDAPLDSPA